jgi:hypothetical protein
VICLWACALCSFVCNFYFPQFCLFLRHQTMDKVQKHNLFNTNTPSSESYRNYLGKIIVFVYSSSSFLGSIAHLRPWPPPQNPAEFLGGFSTIFFFYRVGLLAPRPTPIPEDQASVFISPRGRVATHFSHLL